MTGRDDPRKPDESEMEYWERTGQILSSRVWDEKQQKMVDAKTGKDEWSNESYAREIDDDGMNMWWDSKPSDRERTRKLRNAGVTNYPSKDDYGFISRYDALPEDVKQALKKSLGYEASLTPKEDYDLGMSELEGKIDWEWNKLPMTKRKQIAIDAGVEAGSARELSSYQDWQDVNTMTWYGGQIEEHMRSRGIVHESYAKENDDIKLGDVVKFKDPLADGIDESDARMVVLEDNGDRILVEPLGHEYDEMTFVPTSMMAKSHFVKESRAREVIPSAKDYWEEEGWKEAEWQWGLKGYSTNWNELSKEQQDNVTNKFNAMVDEDPSIFESKSKYSLMESNIGHGGIAIGQEDYGEGWQKCTTCGKEFDVADNEGIIEHVRDHKEKLGYDYESGFIVKNKEATEVSKEDFEYMSRNNIYSILTSVLGWSGQEASAAQDLIDWDDLSKEEQDKVKEYSGEARAREQAPEIFGHIVVTDPSSPAPFTAYCNHCSYETDSVYPKMKEHLKQAHDIAVESRAKENAEGVRDAINMILEDNMHISAYAMMMKLESWDYSDSEIKEGMRSYFGVGESYAKEFEGGPEDYLDIGIDRWTGEPIEFDWKEDIDLMSKQELIDHIDISLPAEEYDYAVALLDSKFGGEAMYGYGSATGRMSPAEHWKQGLDAYGDMGYDSKLASDMYNNFQGMSWNELPEDIKQSYMAKHGYADTTQTEAIRAYERETDFTRAEYQWRYLGDQQKSDLIEWTGVLKQEFNDDVIQKYSLGGLMLDKEHWSDSEERYYANRYYEEKIDELSKGGLWNMPNEIERPIVQRLGELGESKKKAHEDHLWTLDGVDLNCPVCGMDFTSGADMGDHLIVEHEWEESDFEQFEEGRVNEAERKVSPSSYMTFTEPLQDPLGKVIMDQTYGTSEPETEDGQDLTGKTLKRKGNNDG